MLAMASVGTGITHSQIPETARLSELASSAACTVPCTWLTPHPRRRLWINYCVVYKIRERRGRHGEIRAGILFSSHFVPTNPSPRHPLYPPNHRHTHGIIFLHVELEGVFTSIRNLPPTPLCLPCT